MQHLGRYFRDLVRGALGTNLIEQGLVELREAITTASLKRAERKTTIDEIRAAVDEMRHREPYRVDLDKSDDRTLDVQGNGLTISVRPQAEYPFTTFMVQRNSATFQEPLLYSHLALAEMLTNRQFSSVLEIGSRNGTAARAFAFAGKEVITCEIVGDYGADFSGDYLDLKLEKPVDAIWCSHVLEHQRYASRFLEKMFDDLADGGVLAVTVPSALSPLMLGHCNIWTPGHLLYNLILAGFDCSEAWVRSYDWQFSIVVGKKANNIPRISFASTPFRDGTGTLGYIADIIRFFPADVAKSFTPNGHAWGELKRSN